MTEAKPGFSLTSLAGRTQAFPTGGPSLVVFVKEDCETCNTAAPVVEAFQRAYGQGLQVLMPAQSGEANAVFAARHGLTFPVLDDADCKTSFDWDIEIVPSVFWLNADGSVRPGVTGRLVLGADSAGRASPAAPTGKAR